MRKLKIILIVPVVFALMGCATPPPPKPTTLQSSIIGISVKTRSSRLPNMVYFIKMDKEEDLYSQDYFIRSNYCKDDQIYLINAKPGCYAAVACSSWCTVHGGGTYTYSTFFSKELIKLTEVTVAPGTIAFMGEFLVDQSRSFKDVDDAQLQYFHLIEPGANLSTLSTIFFGDSYFTGTMHEAHCDMQDEIKFLRNALEHFKETDWANAIQKRLEELKGEK